LSLEGEKAHKKYTQIQLLVCNFTASCFLQVILTTHLHVKSEMSLLWSANRERRSNIGTKKQGPYGHVNLLFTKPIL